MAAGQVEYRANGSRRERGRTVAGRQGCGCRSPSVIQFTGRAVKSRARWDERVSQLSWKRSDLYKQTSNASGIDEDALVVGVVPM